MYLVFILLNNLLWVFRGFQMNKFSIGFQFQKLLGDLQDDIQNVSAKAYSNDVRYQNTQKHLSALDENISKLSEQHHDKEDKENR